MAIKTIAIWIQYDGVNYSGWQRQLKQPSVQEVIERALSKLLCAEVILHASGRTDAGVHALGQCATFKAELIIPIEKLKYALNNRLPKDIHINQVAVVPDDFHARFSAIGKTYTYKVFVSKERDPFKSRYFHQVAYTLDEMSIREAMQHFLGTHDFSAFKASGSAVENTVRTVVAFDLVKIPLDDGEVWLFTITGTGFLYNMVRIIIGLLMRVGIGKLLPNEIPKIITSGERHLARWTAPPQGLYLKAVYYDEPSLTNDAQNAETLQRLKRIQTAKNEHF